MEFTINKEYLSQAVSDVSKAVSARTTLPILSGIKMAADYNRLTLTGSNAEIVIERVLHSDVQGESMMAVHKTGSIVVSAKYLNDLIKKLPGDLLVKVGENHSVSIQSEDIVVSLKGFHAGEFPRLTMSQPEASHQLPGTVLADMIKRTMFAVSKNGARPVLTGVHFVFDQNFFCSTATDSLRLATYRRNIGANLTGSFIVPQPALHEFLKLMGSYTGEVTLKLTESYIEFSTDVFSFYSRLIAGKYPNTASLIPNEFKTVITLQASDFLKGIDRAALFAGEWKNNNVNLTLLEGKKLGISSRSMESGTIHETQNINSLEGEEELSISLDGKFLTEALRGIKDEEIKISFSGSMKPVLIESVSDSPYQHLISPVRAY